MTRLVTRMCCLISVLLAASFALAQTEFSADMVSTSKQGAPTQGKIYFDKDKIRFESANKGVGSAVIVDTAAQTSTVIMAPRHMYMEVPMQGVGLTIANSFFRSGDVENACPDWLKVPLNKGGSCHKLGDETVNGRDTVKYEGTNSKGDVTTAWLDKKLHFFVKSESTTGSTELRNIQEGPQPASLFEIPAGYTKFDVGGMMGQRPQ
jgi:hypothetical protein